MWRENKKMLSWLALAEISLSQSCIKLEEGVFSLDCPCCWDVRTSECCDTLAGETTVMSAAGYPLPSVLFWTTKKVAFALVTSTFAIRQCAASRMSYGSLSRIPTKIKKNSVDYWLHSSACHLRTTARPRKYERPDVYLPSLMAAPTATLDHIPHCMRYVPTSTAYFFYQTTACNR